MEEIKEIDKNKESEEDSNLLIEFNEDSLN